MTVSLTRGLLLSNIVRLLSHLLNYSDSRETAVGSGYFLVDPVLHYGSDDDVLRMDGIQSQTVLSKNLGPFSDWESVLQVSKESGYNMVHFTPVQELGYSKSAYSIRNQLLLNPNFSTADKTYTFDDLQTLIQKMAREWKVLSATDLVLNHTSSDSQWLHEHPEAAYNLVNSPHLRPAYLFDRILWHFSCEIGEGKWRKQGIPPVIDGEHHLVVSDELNSTAEFPIELLILTLIWDSHSGEGKELPQLSNSLRTLSL